MKGKFKILCACLLIVLLSDLSNGFWLKPTRLRRPLRKCSGSRIGLWRNKGCVRTPITPKPKLSTTMKPRALANPVVPSDLPSVPYCKSSLTEHDVSAILGRRSLRTQPDSQLRVGRRRTKRAVSIATMP